MSSFDILASYDSKETFLIPFIWSSVSLYTPSSSLISLSCVKRLNVSQDLIGTIFCVESASFTVTVIESV